MASKAKSKSGAAKARDPNTLTVIEKEGKSRERKMAELGLSSIVANTNTARTFGKGTFGELDLGESIDVMRAKVDKVKAGDLSDVEATLTVQAATLDAVFNELARRAALNMTEQITSHYRLDEAEAIKYLVQLDRIGIVELRPLNRYRLKLAKTFRWRPHGPVMNFFREYALLDYFSGGFDKEAESLMLVHGSISKSLAPAFVERLQRVAQDFAHQHQTDQKLPAQHREGYTLLLAMRSWDYEVFERFRR